MASKELEPRSVVLMEAFEKAKRGGKPLTSMLSVPEACEQLRISKWTLYREMNEGRLAYVKLGKRRLIPLKSIERFINQLADEEADA